MNEINDQVKYGIQQLNDGNIDAAIDIYKKVFNDYPYEPDEALTYLYYKILRKTNYSNLSEKTKHRIEFYVNLAKKCWKQGNTRYTINKLKLGKKLTNDELFDYYLGKVYFKMGDYENSIIHLKAYNNANGSDKREKSHMYLTVIYIRMNQLNNAQKNYYYTKLFFFLEGKKMKQSLIELLEKDIKKLETSVNKKTLKKHKKS